MILGDWEIDDAGMKACLKCYFKTWSNEHHCWGRHYTGHYVLVTAPALVATVSEILRENWQDSKELSGLY